MSEKTKTPRSDARLAKVGAPLGWYDLAQDLERQLDEARKLAENYRDGWAEHTCPSLAPSHIARLPWESKP